MTLKQRFMAALVLLFVALGGQLCFLYASSSLLPPFTTITGFATPAFHSNHLFLRHPLTQPSWSVFDTHPELREHVRGSFVQTGLFP